MGVIEQRKPGMVNHQQLHKRHALTAKNKNQLHQAVFLICKNLRSLQTPAKIAKGFGLSAKDFSFCFFVNKPYNTHCYTHSVSTVEGVEERDEKSYVL